jgi:hypothetical protein
MVNLISKISKGTKMDQIYLPKLRPPGFAQGDFVEIIPTKKEKRSFYTHNLHQLEPIKNLIKDEIFNYFEKVNNVIIIGSFLEKGFNFNDIDVILVDKIKVNKNWEEYFRKKLGIDIDFICLNRKSLKKGVNTDPLFQMMMSRYLAKKREFFKFKNEFDYKQLDLHLLKSKTLLTSFEVLTGKEKYKLTRNLMAIKLFLEGEKLSKEIVHKKIEKIFGNDIIKKLKENLIEKEIFLKKFRKIYNQLFDKIMDESKQEQINPAVNRQSS